MIIMTTAMWWIWVMGIAVVSLGLPEEEQEKLAVGTYGCAMPPWIADAALSVGIVAWPVMLLTYRVFSLAANNDNDLDCWFWDRIVSAGEHAKMMGL